MRWFSHVCALLAVLALMNAVILSTHFDGAKLHVFLGKPSNAATSERATPSRRASRFWGSQIQMITSGFTMFCIPSDGKILVDVRWEQSGRRNDTVVLRNITVVLTELGHKESQSMLLGPGGQAKFSGLTNNEGYKAQLQGPIGTDVGECTAIPTTSVPNAATITHVDAKDGWKVYVRWKPSDPSWLCGYQVVCAHGTTFERCSRKLHCQAIQYTFYDVPRFIPFKCVRLRGRCQTVSC